MDIKLKGEYPLTKDQAWQLIVNMYSKFHGTKADHDLLQQALEVLQKEVFPQPPPIPEAETKG